MKSTTNNLNAVKHFFEKIFFSSQLIIISAALPVLYCVGVSHNAANGSKVSIIRTNKGKVIMKLDDGENKTYSMPVSDNSVEKAK